MLAVEPDGGGVKVRTARRTLEADVAVVAAGPWATELLQPLGLSPPLGPGVAQVTFFEAPALLERPTFGDWREGAVGVYGHPVPGVGYKVGFDAASAEAWDPDATGYTPDAAEEARLLDWMREHAPGIEPRPLRSERHPWTMTPDGDLVVDRRGPVVILAGCSGHASSWRRRSAPRPPTSRRPERQPTWSTSASTARPWPSPPPPAWARRRNSAMSLSPTPTCRPTTRRRGPTSSAAPSCSCRPATTTRGCRRATRRWWRPRMEPATVHLLGRLDDVPALAVGLPADAPTPEGWHASGLRGYWDRLDEDHFALAGRAFQLLEWDRTSRFCGRCGTPTERCPANGRSTARPAAHHLPAPVPGGDRPGDARRAVLLRRACDFPAAFYSVLAGFVEPGESLEDTVRREIREEVGIEVTDIRYFGSQPWPFPNSLMIGFTATYAGGELRPEPTELADAGWFRWDALPDLPGRLSIARRLIDAFVDAKRAGATV